MLRALLISLSESRWLRAVAERSSVGKRISGRFVAGTEVEDALRVAKALNKAGLGVSIDNLGENVTTSEEALHSADLYRRLLSEISARGLSANVSVKLTHMGLDVDPKLAYDNVSAMVAQAAVLQPKNFVRVDMEGSVYTQRTLDFVHQLHRVPENQGVVGAVIGFRDARKHCARCIRISNAVRHPARLAAVPGARRMADARLCSVWDGMVSLSDAAPGGAAGERLICC